MEEVFVSALDGIAPESDDWKLKFIRSWRLWPERNAREKAAHLAYIIADTRILDHTLWHHNALAAAFTTTGGEPAFLLLQIGIGGRAAFLVHRRNRSSAPITATNCSRQTCPIAFSRWFRRAKLVTS